MRLYEIARSAAACDTLQVKQQAEINRLVQIETGQQAQITELTGQVIWTKASLGECHHQGEHQKALIDIQKRKKRRWIFAFFGLTAIFIATEAVQ